METRSALGNPVSLTAGRTIANPLRVYGPGPVECLAGLYYVQYPGGLYHTDIFCANRLYASFLGKYGSRQHHVVGRDRAAGIERPSIGTHPLRAHPHRSPAIRTSIHAPALLTRERRRFRIILGLTHGNHNQFGAKCPCISGGSFS
jgi:hypothetical protein